MDKSEILDRPGTLFALSLGFMETTNEIYYQFKAKGILKGQKLEFLNYLCLFGPCSANELIEEVKNKGLIKNALDLSKLNRHPSVLKRLGVIEVHSKRKCKVSSSNKDVEILQVVSKLPELKKKPKGKTLKIIESSLNAALLAVEIYNKPRVTFRTESYISLMVNAWTKAMHAFIRLNKGEVYFYPKEKGQSKKKTWDLSKCIQFTGVLSDSVEANLRLFVDLRNEVEHGLVDDLAVDISLFGECQSLLFNFESFVIEQFGREYSLNQSLAFSLQFSMMRDSAQLDSEKKLLSSEAKDIVGFLEKFRGRLNDDVFNSQEFSVKLDQVPRISNTSRNDVAIKFVKYDELSDEDKKNYDTVNALIKKQVEKVAVANAGLYKPGQSLAKINENLKIKINFHDLNCLYDIFTVRPKGKTAKNPETTITDLCIYDQPNSNYLYTDAWIKFVIGIYTKHGFTIEKVREIQKAGKKLKYSKF